MGVLMRVVDRCIVLDHGEVIAQGKPAAVARDRKVIEVYLGTDADCSRLARSARGIAASRRCSTSAWKSRRARRVAVIGPNGAGKTTLLRVISKLIEATSGEIRMEGTSLARVPAHEVVSAWHRARAGEPAPVPRLTVEENLRMARFPARRENCYEERLKFVYSLFPRLEERRGQLAGTLSGASSRCAPSAAR